ncbi:MAG: hypothetical protein Q4615_15235 [Paracoccus aminovorans]|nr:hypothetical protein [Paracoccus aminovorans]
MSIAEKFSRLGTDNAPGQEVRQSAEADFLLGEALKGHPVDFSHGDVDAHEPTPGAFGLFSDGVAQGGRQAYTEYRGSMDIRALLAPRLAAFTGSPVDAENGLIITPGTQGALFLAVAATVSRGDKVAIVQPDYFARSQAGRILRGRVAAGPAFLRGCG